MKSYAPPDPIEGTLEAATVRQLTIGAIELQEVLEFDGVDVRVRLDISAHADVEWLVTAPTPADLAAYEEVVEGDATGGGWIGATEAMGPVDVEVEAPISPEAELLEWDNLEVTLARD